MKTSFFDESSFSALNDLFFDVDSYCADPSLRDDGDLDEQELRSRAKETLEILLKNKDLP